MTSLNGFYPDMFEYPAHEWVCRECGEVLEVVPCEERGENICEECKEVGEDND